MGVIVYEPEIIRFLESCSKYKKKVLTDVLPNPYKYWPLNITVA